MQLTAEDYELPTFGPKLREVVKNVSLGRGFQLLRCTPFLVETTISPLFWNQPLFPIFWKPPFQCVLACTMLSHQLKLPAIQVQRVKTQTLHAKTFECLITAAACSPIGALLCSGFPVDHYKGDRFGLVVAYWGLALTLGEPQVSQTDYNQKHETFGECFLLKARCR